VIPLRDDFAHWLADALGVPSFLYGPLPGGRTRTLPEIRRRAFVDLPPDFGPPRPDERAGASAVGAREVLVAYNVWVTSPEVARRVAPLIRGPELRALGLAVGGRAQVSCNLVAPALCGPERVFDRVSVLAQEAGGAVEGAELVGLLPRSVLHAITPGRWPELGLAEAATVEARLDR
jgi:glutamate formiminotransferase